MPAATARPASKLRPRIFLAVPAATLATLGVHWFISKKELPLETHSYSLFLVGIFALAMAATAIQPFSPRLRRWMAGMCPIISAALLLLCGWELITTGFRLLPLP